MISRHLDEETGIIMVIGTGDWTFPDIEQHYCALRQMIEELRDKGVPVRVLSNVTHATRQAPWVEDYIKLQMEQTFQEGDRVAILVASQADKAHLRSKLPRQAEIWSFNSRLAAEQWLLLWDEAGYA